MSLLKNVSSVRQVGANIITRINLQNKWVRWNKMAYHAIKSALITAREIPLP